MPKLDGARAHQLLTHLESAGLSAVHPLTHALFGFRETPVGNREPLMGDGAALAAALADDRYSRIEFTCWKGYDQSLTGIVRRTDDATQSITLRLTDVPVPDREEAVAALVRTLDQDAADCLRDRMGDHPELAGSKPTAYGPLDVFHRA